MKNLLILCLILISVSSFSQEQKLKYCKARIYYNTVDDLKILSQSGVALDNGTHKKGSFIESDFSSRELEIIKKLGLKTEILIEDLENYYVQRNELSKAANGISKENNFKNPENYNHGTMGGFLTYSQVMDEFDDMKSLYPNLISERAVIDTFKTFEGRNLHWVRISDNPNTNEDEPEILYNGVHHAREPIGVQQMVYYMWYLLENYETDAEIKAIIDNTELYFIPIVNPDGYVYNETTNPNGGGMWRKNRRDHGDGSFGVDPNRNYDYTDGENGNIWGTSGISFDTYDETYCGDSAFSEPENQAMKWFVEHHEFKIALNNHSFSNLLLFPFGFEENRITEDHDTFVAISELMVAQNSLVNQLASMLYACSGDSDDWMYGQTDNHSKIYAFTPEIGSNDQGFWPLEGDIDALCQSMLHLNLTAAHLVSNYAKITDIQEETTSEISGYFNYNIQGLGLDNTGLFSVSILPISSNILSVGAAKEYSNLSLLQSIDDSINYTLASTINPGDEIKYVLSLNNGSFVVNDTLSKIFGTQKAIFIDNCENIDLWDSPDSWGITNTTYYSTSNSITDSPNGDYNSDINKKITLAHTVSLNNALVANLTFYAKWNIEQGWDYAQLEISNDNGANWTSVNGKYTVIGNENQATDDPIYDGIQPDWVKEYIDLTDFIGDSILIQFKIVSDGNVNEDGFYFDDLSINIIEDVTDNILEKSPSEVKLGQNIPNPAINETTINYNIEAINGRLCLKNQLGQTVLSKNIKGNESSITLNTKDIPSGIYIYYIEMDAKLSESKKMIIE
ncbi:MAG: immune inhibitor A [Salinivirgaceae bacterium]|nr:immune inhibitor A [Salinivirgaceae bacterium]